VPLGPVWIGNVTTGAMAGCCPDCAMFHDGARAMLLCRRLRQASGEVSEGAALRLLLDAVRAEHWDDSDATHGRPHAVYG
jgi:hypothetical protein